MPKIKMKFCTATVTETFESFLNSRKASGVVDKTIQTYLMNGGNAFNLQKLLGHSTLDMTKHYCRIYDAEIAKDYDKFSPLATLK